VSHQSISRQCEREKKKEWSTAGCGAIVAGGAGGETRGSGSYAKLKDVSLGCRARR
jgi:hypothetical protein